MKRVFFLTIFLCIYGVVLVGNGVEAAPCPVATEVTCLEGPPCDLTGELLSFAGTAACEPGYEIILSGGGEFVINSTSPFFNLPTLTIASQVFLDTPEASLSSFPVVNFIGRQEFQWDGGADGEPHLWWKGLQMKMQPTNAPGALRMVVTGNNSVSAKVVNSLVTAVISQSSPAQPSSRGGLIEANGLVEFFTADSTYSNGWADAGGAISLEDTKDIEMWDCLFTTNRLRNNPTSGSAVDISYTPAHNETNHWIHFRGTSFSDNLQVFGETHFGGTVSLELRGESHVLFETVTFDGNIGGGYGSCISYANGQQGSLHILDNTIRFNNGSGVPIYVQAPPNIWVRVEGGEMHDNNAQWPGKLFSGMKLYKDPAADATAPVELNDVHWHTNTVMGEIKPELGCVGVTLTNSVITGAVREPGGTGDLSAFIIRLNSTSNTVLTVLSGSDTLIKPEDGWTGDEPIFIGNSVRATEVSFQGVHATAENAVIATATSISLVESILTTKFVDAREGSLNIDPLSVLRLEGMGPTSPVGTLALNGKISFEAYQDGSVGSPTITVSSAIITPIGAALQLDLDFVDGFPTNPIPVLFKSAGAISLAPEPDYLLANQPSATVVAEVAAPAPNGQLSLRYAPNCGDGIINGGLGENCEPPGSGNCDLSCQLMIPTIVSGLVSNDGSSFTMTISEDVGQPACGPLFVQPASFGTGWSCNWQSATDVRVILGDESTVESNSRIHMRLRPEDPITSKRLTASLNPVQPAPGISMDAVVSSCGGTVPVTASAPEAGLANRRLFSSVEWALYDANLEEIPIVVHTGETQQQPLDPGEGNGGGGGTGTDPRLSVDLGASLPVEPGTFTIEVRLTNWIGGIGQTSRAFNTEQSTDLSVGVRRSGQAVEDVDPTSRVDEDLTLTAIPSLSECGSEADASVVHFDYQWTISPPIDGADNGGTSTSNPSDPTNEPANESVTTATHIISLTSKTLNLPAGTLSAETVYSISVTVTTSRSGQLHEATSNPVVINGEAPPPEASIIGGDMTVSTGTVVNFLARTSHNSLYYNTVGYSWTCWSGSSRCVNRNTGTQLASSNGPAVEVNTDLLGDGMFEWRLTVTADSASSVASVHLTVETSEVPLPVVRITQHSEFREGQKTSLVAECELPEGTTGLAEYLWSVSPTGAVDLTDADTVLTSVTSRELLLASHALRGGDELSFTVTCQRHESNHGDAGVATNEAPAIGLASLTRTVNNAPNGDSCTVTPNGGEALVTPFQLSCSTIADPEGDTPISIAVAYRLHGGAISADGRPIWQALDEDFVIGEGLTLHLPRGDATFGHKVDIRFKVTDDIGSADEVIRTVTVLPATAVQSAIEDVVVKEAEEATGAKDLTAALEVLQSGAVELNLASLEELSQEDRTLLRQQLIELTSEALDGGSLEELGRLVLLAAQLIEALAAKPEDIRGTDVHDELLLLLDAVVDAVEVFIQPQLEEESGLELGTDLEGFEEAFAAAISSVLEAFLPDPTNADAPAPLLRTPERMTRLLRAAFATGSLRLGLTECDQGRAPVRTQLMSFQTTKISVRSLQVDEEAEEGEAPEDGQVVDNRGAASSVDGSQAIPPIDSILALAGIDPTTEDACLSLQLFTFDADPYSYADNSEEVISKMLEYSVDVNGEALVIEGLNEHFVFWIPLGTGDVDEEAENRSGGDDIPDNPVCCYFDHENNRWSTDGVQTGSHNGTHQECFATHLSSFAVLIGGDGSNDDEFTGIHLASVICFGAAALLVLLIILGIRFVPPFRVHFFGKEGHRVEKVREASRRYTRSNSSSSNRDSQLEKRNSVMERRLSRADRRRSQNRSSTAFANQMVEV